MLGLIVGLKENTVYVVMILILLGLVIFFVYPVFGGWKQDKEYRRGKWEEYTLGVWKPEKGLLTLIDKDEEGMVHLVNFDGLDKLPLVLTCKTRLGISWCKKTVAPCPDDQMMVVGKWGLDNFEKIIDFGGGECGRNK